MILKRLSFGLLLPLLALSSHASPPSFQIQASLGSEDDGKTSETIQQLTGAFRYSKGLSRQSAINLNVDLSTERYQKSKEKDNYGLLLEGVYNYVPNAGFTKPVYSIVLRHTFEKYELDLKDTNITSLLLVDFMRLTEDTSVNAGIEFSQSSSDELHSSLFGIFAGIDHWISENGLLYANLKLQNEDIDSWDIVAARPEAASARPLYAMGHGGTTNTNLPSGTLKIDPTSKASSDSTNTFITVGFVYEFDARQSVDVSFSHREYDAARAITVKHLSLDYFFRF